MMTITKGILLLLIFALGSPTLSAQSLFARSSSAGGRHSLISDHTAQAIGDILTIIVREQHSVKQEDKTTRTKQSSFQASLESFKIKPSMFKGGILPDLDVRSSSSNEGQAKQERDSKFDARVAVTVVDILPNGNLVLSGTRAIVIDDEEKILKISGIVRSFDITADNTILSSQVAEAKIAILGKGRNTETVTKGPVGRVFQTVWWLVWPF
jgi:flagellar L-ring protein precursor FlgH